MAVGFIDEEVDRFGLGEDAGVGICDARFVDPMVFERLGVGIPVRMLVDDAVE